MTDLERRDELVLAHMPQVRWMAHEMARKIPCNVDEEDLYQAGLEALIPTADRFEPDKGKKFWTYANFRVRGAMLDYLRLIDTVPRTGRRLQKQALEFRHKYKQKFNHEPSDSEIAKALEIPLARWLKWKPYICVCVHDTKILDGEQGVVEREFKDLKSLPDDNARVAEIRRHLKIALDKLPERYREVMVQYFFQGRTLKEAGKSLGIAESRASQIRTASLEIMRLDLAKNGISLDMFMDK